ncbi:MULTISPECIES: hypothetical protein [Streptomyces]|uniref:Uncharacterized protein n=1 Tax=Streptomyces clavifer TaxID=68188 RepID=A0ABS4VHH3_9ACTN|nr:MULTISPECIES: hypothetical protein [Streptomyces]MBP2363373.1 hypothetical protein [Streptomyces clavifer]MDX2747992.1 hypothetical protein [Streptomyces sp. NRRL_B-2557]GHB29623.1 hypothetical protein GCM10010392_67290 [Streptomyces clavifer]
MADPADEGGSREGERSQDPLVEKLRPDPSKPPIAGVTLNGVLGDSDRPGHRRLYFTAELDYFIEFSVDDVLRSSRIPPDKAPFPGSEATQITLRKGADIAYTHTTVARPPDEFDLNVRRRRTRPATNPGETGYSMYTCDTDTREECHTAGWYTCTCTTCQTCGETACDATCHTGLECYPEDNWDTALSCIPTMCTPPCPNG